MRRLLTTIVCVFCVLTASAVSYGASYKGSARKGYVYTTSSAYTTTIGSGGVIASAPLASMGSTSSFGSRASQMSPIGTSNVAMVGGVISGAALPNSFLLGGGGHGTTCPNCIDEIINETGEPGKDGLCDRCGHDMLECTCEDEDGYCWCPISDGWQVWLFMAVMAFAYAVFKKRKASL